MFGRYGLAHPTVGGDVQYKVLTQKDKALSGRFSPEKLEEALNGYAADGWRVVSMATVEFPGLGRTRDEVVVLLEHP